jgi:predicted esterase
MTEREQNEPGLSSALQVLSRLVADVLAKGIASDHLVLLGFSQGACLTAEFAVRNPRRYGGVIVYSGGLIGPPGTRWDHRGRFDGTPVFLGCSDVDAHIPQARVDESASVFERMGAAVTRRIYPGMGHLVNDDEIAFARTLLAELAGSPG